MSADGQHILASYGNQNSWALVYNLYADRLLETNLVPDSVSAVCRSTAIYGIFTIFFSGLRYPDAILCRTFNLQFWLVSESCSERYLAKTVVFYSHSMGYQSTALSWAKETQVGHVRCSSFFLKATKLIVIKHGQCL